MRSLLFLSLTTTLIIIVLVVPPLTTANRSQEKGSSESAGRAMVGYAVNFAESQPVRDFAKLSNQTGSSGEIRELDEKREQRREKQFAQSLAIQRALGLEVEEKNPLNREITRRQDPNAPRTPDKALSAQTSKLKGPTPHPPNPPTLSFEGVSIANTIAIGQGFVPPDTNGDVGPAHYVQTVNVAFRIWDKTGNPLTPVASLNTLFGPIGGACGSSEDGDPIVMYDQLADRWLISQFCTVANPNNHQLIAISKTGDPTGSYYLYDFMMPNNKFNDYPKFGVWPDAYYMTDNQFNQSGTTFLQAGVFAFNRSKMLTGDPTASFIYFDTAVLFPPGTGINGPNGIGGLLPADVEGYIPPPAGAPCPFMYFQANEFGEPADQLRLFDFHADFTTPAASTFSERVGSPLVVAPFDPVPVPNSRDVIPQPPPATAASFLDAITDFLMFRLSYRNFGSNDTLIASHTVNAATNPAFRAGVRFYQLNRSIPGGAFIVGEQQTWAPADTEHRWMGSAANNFKGDAAVGFSTSSATVFPSIRYAARLGTDLPGTGLALGETSIIAGGGSQTSTQSRWGDYSDMTVDPSDDCTFWYTQEYYPVSSEPGNTTAPWHTRIAKFAPGPCSVSPRGNISGTITNCLTGLPLQNALVSITGGYSRATDAAGTYSAIVTPATYNGSVTRFGYDTAATTGLVIANGGAATFNACLNGTLKQPVADTASIAADSCNSNGTIDPNETISVSLGVKNTGTLNTVNLVGTLQATGGVTSPSGPQSYGVVVAGGATVFRTFTFTAANQACGAAVVVSLQLQDGATDLGTITYNFTTGSIAANNYSTGNIAVPIPDSPNPAVDIPITVADVMTLSDVNVSFRINHTFDGDLRISLVHPDNTVIPLVTNRGSNGANFGTGPNDCSGTPTFIDDQAATAISAGASPFAGSFRPESPLSALNGKPSNGTWKLRVQDTANLDTGTVGCIKLELNKHSVCCGPLINSAPPAVVTAESITPANNAPDPNETVTVSLPLINVGENNTTNLLATLQPTGGVSSPSGPQNYGVVVASGPAVSRSFTFVAQGACGSNITLTLALQDGPTNLGTVTFTMQLGTLSVSTIFSENFDGVTPPALPAGWVTAHTGSELDWVTSTTNPNSAPNDAFAPDVATVGNTTFDTPTINVPSFGGQLTFKNLFNMEAAASPTGSGFDGMVLEISINGGAFADITTGGNAFVAGGYTRTISGSFSSPIAGRQAWSGLSGGTTAAPTYITSTINLPAAANGQPIKLRWRAATDTSAVAAGATGVRIDSIVISGSSPVCNTQACSLTCPPNILVVADAGATSAVVNYPSPVLTGGCGVANYNVPSGSTFPLGVTSVTANGIGAGCTFTVHVVAGGPSAGSLLISEFRERGSGGANDEFVELYNPTDSPLTISVSDGSAGWALVASDNVTRFVIPNGTVIPSHGHYLGVNSSGYSLSNYGGTGAAAGDVTYTTDIPDDSGLALFRSSNPANFTTPNKVDAAGFTSTVVGFKEGLGLPPLAGAFSTEHSFVRDNCGKGGSISAIGACPSGGNVVDTGNNATDFYFVDTNGTLTSAGQRLGAPGPENLTSPIQRNASVTASLVFPCTGGGASPNRIRDFTSDPANSSTFGTLEIRRAFTNNTGAPVTRLRFRVVDITTFPAPSGIADLRVRTSTALGSVTNPCGAAVNLDGVVLEEPAAQPNGGAFNSSLSIGTVTLGPIKNKRGRVSTSLPLRDGSVQLNAPLGVGSTINIRFLLGIQQTGNFRFFLNVEALP